MSPGVKTHEHNCALGRFILTMLFSISDIVIYTCRSSILYIANAILVYITGFLDSL